MLKLKVIRDDELVAKFSAQTHEQIVKYSSFWKESFNTILVKLSKKSYILILT